MKHFRSCLALVAAGLIFTAADATAQVKIATVDIGRILNESPDAQTKKKELDAMSQDAKKKAEAKRKELQAMQTKLKESAAGSKDAEQYESEAKEYQRFVRDAEDDIKKKYLKVNKEIIDKAMGRVAAYAKANAIDLVLDKSDRFRGPVLFGAETADITDDILKSLGK